MTEDQKNMDVKSVQQRTQLPAKKFGSQGDSKRNPQKSKKSDSSRNVVWSSSTKRQNADSRFSGKKEKSCLKYQEIGSVKPLKQSEEHRRVEDLDELTPNNASSAGQHKKLINFRFAPANRAYKGESKRGNYKSWSHAKSPVYSKEAYVQANCQFIVQEERDYALHAIDPDIMVDWKFVEQVRVSSYELVTCPICLETPIAAKITRCGHIYCWSCILHYLSLSEKSWRKCPICHEAVVAEDLRSVATSNIHLFMRGDRITMKLMKRKKGSVFCWPISSPAQTEGFTEWTGDASSSTCKLQTASSKIVHKNIIELEMNALQKQLEDAKLEESGEDCFIEMAIQKLKDKEKDLLQKIRLKQEAVKIGPETGNEFETTLLDVGSAMREIESKGSSGVDDEPAFSDDDIEDLEGNETKDEIVENGGMKSNNITFTHDDSGLESSSAERAVGIANSEYYYFYQAEDFQNIYLQPINVRCLIREYGSFEACPETISARIISIESFSMNQGLRNRYRYLSHLPVSCGFSLCELIFQPPTVSREVLSEFSEEFHRRKQQRQKKKRDERKLERRIENRRTTDVFGREIHIPSKDVPLDLESFEEFPTQNGSAENNDSPSSTSLATSPNSWGASSFASALQSKAKAPTPSARPTKARTESSCSSDGAVGKLENDEEESSVPDFATAFSDALNASMASLDMTSHDLESKKNKKKQKGKKLLFSTGGFMKYS